MARLCGFYQCIPSDTRNMSFEPTCTRAWEIGLACGRLRQPRSRAAYNGDDRTRRRGLHMADDHGYTMDDPLDWPELSDKRRQSYQSQKNRGSVAQKVAVLIDGMLNEPIAYVERLATYYPTREIGFLELRRRHDEHVLAEMRSSSATATAAARAAMWAAIGTFAAVIVGAGMTWWASTRTTDVAASKPLPVNVNSPEHSTPAAKP